MYNYILLNEGFYRWCDTNHLPIGSQLLFLKLVHLFNMSGWSEWVVVDNWRMMSLVQTKREQTVIEWRDKLIEKQLLFYVKGKKGLPNKYKLNDKLTFINEAKTVVKDDSCEVETVVKSVVFPEVFTAANTADIYKKNKTKPNKTKNISLTTFEIYNNCDENDCIETCEASQSKNPKERFGEFENVLLTKEELDKLKSSIGEQTESYIERLSNYIASTGKRYKSHYATILSWVQKDNRNNTAGGESYGNVGKLCGRKLCTEYPE